MKITAAHIGIDGTKLQGEESCDILDMASDPEFRAKGVIKYDIFAQLAGSDLVTRGVLETEFEACCAKCGRDFTFTARVDSFTHVYPIRNKSDVIDLTSDIREDIILVLPSIAVCSPSCKGLCARCGKNLNEGPCACDEESENNCWNVFDVLD